VLLVSGGHADLDGANFVDDASQCGHDGLPSTAPVRIVVADSLIANRPTPAGCDPDSDRRRAELFEADGGGIHPAQALAVLAAHGVAVPPGVRAYLETTPDCPGPDDPRMSRVTNQVIAAPQQSLEAAAAVAREAVVTPVVLGDSLEGQAREVGIVLAGITRQVLRHGQPAPPPCVLLSGGRDHRVRARVGSRNVELLLSLAVALRGAPGVHAIACDTDGVDGVEEIAGALVGPDTLRRARDLDVDAAAALAPRCDRGASALLLRVGRGQPDRVPAALPHPRTG